MNNLPKEYLSEQRLTKDAIIKGLDDSKHKKLVREFVSKITLKATIKGENIPSVVNDDFNVQVITFIDVMVKDIKCVTELSTVLQNTIKNFVIIRFLYKDKQILSFGLKRLNKNFSNQIVIDTIFNTSELEITNDTFNKYFDYTKILNTSNKILFYREVMVKCFVISNSDLYNDFENLLNSNLWYENTKVIEVYKLFVELNSLMKKKKRVNEHREMVAVNIKIMKIIKRLCEI